MGHVVGTADLHKQLKNVCKNQKSYKLLKVN